MIRPVVNISTLSRVQEVQFDVFLSVVPQNCWFQPDAEIGVKQTYHTVRTVQRKSTDVLQVVKFTLIVETEKHYKTIQLRVTWVNEVDRNEYNIFTDCYTSHPSVLVGFIGSNEFDRCFEVFEGSIRIEYSYSGLLHTELAGFTQQSLRQTVADRYVSTGSLIHQRFDLVVQHFALFRVGSDK